MPYGVPPLDDDLNPWSLSDDQCVAFRQEVRVLILDAPEGTWDEPTLAAARMLRDSLTARLQGGGR